MTAQRQPPGAAGGKQDRRGRHHQIKVRNRQMNRRVQAALDAARHDREALDARIAAEARAAEARQPVIVLEMKPEAEAQASLEKYQAEHPQPTQEEFVTAVEAAIPEMRERFRTLSEAEPTRWHAGTGHWTLQQAVDMLEQGYQLSQVVRKTGWGAGWFQEFQLEGGYLA